MPRSSPFALAVAVVLLAGCAAGSSAGSSPSPTPPVSPAATTTAPTSAPPVASRPTYRSVCGGFRAFYATMSSNPPSQVWGRLIDEAQGVDDAPGSPRLRHLADALLDYVTAGSFPHEGNLAGRPVQDLADACF